jgi:DNA-binding transcriptional ArsR family regulator
MFVPRKARQFDWDAISSYYAAGHTVKECRERFGFSNRAWSDAVARGDVQPRRDQSGRPRGQTREAVRALIAEGLTFAAIAAELGISRPTVSFHARKLGIPAHEPAVRRYDWVAVQRFYDAGHSMRECCREFGFSKQAWYQAVDRGLVRPRAPVHPLANYLIVGRRVNRFHLKTHLFNAGLKTNCCEACGITEWLGRPLTMALHHINGDSHDNRLENLQILCPNCHSQTENFAGRNVIRNGNGADAIA